MKIQLVILLCFLSGALQAQQEPLQYFRTNNKQGINVFETGKSDSVSFTGLNVRVGGNFTQNFQALSHRNNALFVNAAGKNANQLIELTHGFNLAMANLNANAWSGRFNPSFSQQVTTFMINPFVKYKGIELFGTYEMAKGRKISEPDMRQVTQYAVDLIYRFPARSESFWIGGRFNSVKAELPLTANAVTIYQVAGSAGWFLTRNIMLKGEYVRQDYKDFVEGQFNGMVMSAVVAF